MLCGGMAASSIFVKCDFGHFQFPSNILREIENSTSTPYMDSIAEPKQADICKYEIYL